MDMTETFYGEHFGENFMDGHDEHFGEKVAFLWSNVNFLHFYKFLFIFVFMCF